MCSMFDLIKEAKSLLMLSGGPDSVYLFHKLIRSGADFAVLHVNHHLRGDESDAEEHFVASLCARYSVTCHVHHIHLASKTGIQNTTRILRYQKAAGLCSEHSYKYVLTAHHQDDHLETLIHRTNRGAGIAGLCGIKDSRRFFIQGREFVLLRPLLGISKSNILQYLHKQGLDYCEDSSNKTTGYLRNHIRHTVMANWCDGSQKQELVTLSQRLQIIDGYFARRLESMPPFFVPRFLWRLWPEELRFRFFARALRLSGFVKEVQSKHFSCLQGPEGSSVFGNIQVLWDASGVRVVSPELASRVQQRSLIHSCGSYFYGGLGMGLSLRLVPRERCELSRGSGVVYISPQKFSLPLEVGVLQKGEVWVPFGHSQPCKLKDSLSQGEFARHQKWFWPVLRAPSGQVVCVPGFEVSQPAALSPEDTTAYEVCLLR